MDKNEKIKFVNETENYLEKNQIYDLFRGLTVNLVKDKPSNPIKYIIQQLKLPQQAQIVIIGPPGSNKKECATSLAERLQISDVISVSFLINNEIKNNTELGKQIISSREKSINVDDEIILRLVKNALDSFKKENKNWILEGFPRTKVQAICMQKWGYLPDCFFILNTDMNIVIEALKEKILSPEYGSVNGIINTSDKESIKNYIQTAIATYNSNINEIKLITKNFYYEFDTKVVFDELIDQMLSIANIKIGIRAPLRRPHIIILGPPGSGRTTIAEKIAKKLGLIFVSTNNLLEKEIIENTVTGKIASELVRQGEMVPDEYISKIVEKRLKCSDCLVNGWVLDNFPRTQTQINLLKNLRIHPSLIILLNITQKVSLERIEGRKIDVVTGNIYNLKKKALDDDSIEKNLVQIEQDKEEIIKKRWKAWEEFNPLILSEYETKLYEIKQAERSEDSLLTEILDKIESL